jgi:hypothetical protein
VFLVGPLSLDFGSVAQTFRVNTGDRRGPLPPLVDKYYNLLMIFSALNRASRSDTASSGVTMLEIVLPLIKLAGCRIGVSAARQCPGRRS